ncbi:MAG: HypC/HybG/HupF family hydrogenase formation chaperone [Actinomycetia bacterium]|nr:HypC/HybG/HupF family hydrogenase formation chaperone [Actinomycetes bacterium]
MCLGIPGKVVETAGEGFMRTGRIDFDGIIKDVSLAYVPDVVVGDYVIVHVGFAITQLDEASAQETLALLRLLDVVDEELDPDVALAAESARAAGRKP